ncbi:GntR family transcriptional regulator, partial [Kitasatospora sp. NPDC002965]|uniref:GntR family transcriptional regulator n=1 Tax=Kitasatospora sp. NPDC002965 TaxID=3154775 RepID=UPI0033B90F47
MDRSKEAGADFLQLDPREAPAGGLADWLAHRLRRAVTDGRLPVGSRLPATRVLAADLRVSRGVVTDAYRRLAEEGRVAGRGRGGTVVVDPLAPPARAGAGGGGGPRGGDDPAVCRGGAVAASAGAGGDG